MNHTTISTYYTSMYVALLSIMLYTPLDALFSFKKIGTFFNKPAHEHSIHKEFCVKPNAIVSIENKYGNIYIKKEWTQNSIAVAATKKIATKDANDDVTIIEESNEQSLNIKTVATKPKSKSSMDLTIIIPRNITLNLITANGNITLNDGISGDITTSTQNGNITLHNPHANVKAETYNKGNITITDSKKNVIAKSNKGAIKVQCKELHADNKIWVKTNSGAVTLDLPEQINAELQAKTNKGTLTCDAPVTIKSYTTALNKQSWNRFKREVDGIIGTNNIGDAEIKVVAQSSSIKIRKSNA